MKHAAGTLLFIARFAVLGLALAFAVSLFWPGSGERLRARFGLATTVTRAAPEQSHLGNGPVSYADAVATAAPSVVNIYANKIVTEQAVKMYDNPVLQQLFGGQPTTYQHREQTLGSGVIVSTQGKDYVLTNNHVIAHAADIQVLLFDGRIAKATLVGADPESDLAVLKIDASNLPVIRMASEPPRPGDVVLAIGNPLGLNQTVTMGIVSAIGRQLNSSSAEDFIQTDAAINLGNSGGALVNARGALVGISTLLIGKAAGAEGIGFAIPGTTAKKVLDQIIATGHVVRGWIGAEYAFVPVPANSGLPAAARGAQVTSVYPGGPAAAAGIQPHDVLLRIGTDDILDPSDLRRHEAALKPGSKVELSGLRNGSAFHAEITLAQRPMMSANSSDS
ncbi:MAG: trypsin-like peptidase domain-containing protein [Pseudomonadota bacterium]|nr:trypsin-like peptidase domain-containing protein [Pseudomonadota bacterium]